MTEPTLTKTTLTAGLWQGVLTGPDTPPPIEVLHLDIPLEGVRVSNRDGGGWQVEVPIPAEAISDGGQTFLVNDAGTGRTLASFSVLAGEALAEDIRTEVDLLRAELDMLKKAFRRHCLETG